MSRFTGAVLALAVVVGSARADDKDAAAVLDKGIKALGGEEKLTKIKAASSRGSRKTQPSRGPGVNSGLKRTM